MLSRILIGLVAAGAAAFGASGVAVAEPPAPPPPPPPPFNVNTLAPVSPSEYGVTNGDIYAFTIPGGAVCVMSRGTGGYGCNGALPGAPEGANAVTGSQQGVPGFSIAGGPLYNFASPPKALTPGSRISFRNVTCGTDGTATVCSNNFDGAGFVVQPAGSFVLQPNNPLLLNTGEGRNPYFN